jgi:hypothetical protein
MVRPELVAIGREVPTLQPTFPAIDTETAQVIRKARNRLRSVGRRFRGTRSPDDPGFVKFLQRHNGITCWFHWDREPELHATAQKFESTFELGETRAAVIADALRVW